MDDVLTRIDKLERENRRLKRGGLVVLLLTGTFVLMGQAPSNKIIEAEKLILRSGSHTYAELGIDSSGTPALSFFDDSGKRVAEYRRGGASIFGKDGAWSHWTEDQFVIEGREGHIDLAPIQLSITDTKNGLGLISLGMHASWKHEGVVEPEMYFTGNNGRGFTHLSAIEGLHLEPGMFHGQVLPGGFVDISADGPSIEVEDQRGFKSTIGNVKLTVERSGQERSTSASSIVLFAKDGKVIWSAP